MQYGFSWGGVNVWTGHQKQTRHIILPESSHWSQCLLGCLKERELGMAYNHTWHRWLTGSCIPKAHPSKGENS